MEGINLELNTLFNVTCTLTTFLYEQPVYNQQLPDSSVLKQFLVLTLIVVSSYKKKKNA